MKEEFKFEEDIGDTPKRTRASKKFSSIIALLVGLFFGITVFIIVSLLINKNTTKEIPIKELDIEDEQIQELYQLVSNNKQNNYDPIFVQNKSIDQESMTNQDKYLLTLSLVKEDDLIDSDIKKEKKKVYYLTPDIIRDNMKKIFGNEVKYTRDTKIENYIFEFKKDELNTANIEYDQTAARYEIIFVNNTKAKEDIPTNKNYYSKLSKAEGKDNSLILTEKIIYTKCIEEKDNYKCDLYQDYDKTVKLDELEIDDEGIDIDSLKEVNTIKYTFNKNEQGEYYFTSSKIEK